MQIADALDVDLPELFRIDQEILNRKEIEKRIAGMVKNLPNDALRQVFVVLKSLYPTS